MKKLLFFFLFVVFHSCLFSQTAPSYVPANGLVGWWPFSNNALDLSGKGNNGTVYNTTLTTDRFGNLNAAYSFNGNNSRIEVPDAASLRCRKITLSAWVKTAVIAGKQLIYKGTMNGDYEAYSLNSAAFGGHKINSNCDAAVGWVGTNFSQPLNIGIWEHLVYTFDGTQAKVYRNGVLDTLSNSPGLIDSCIGGGLRFGFNHLRYFASTGDPFNGSMDDIGIWNRALSANEIHQLFTNTNDCGNGNMGINVCTPERNLHVKDVMRLEPRDTEPSNPAKGDIYFDGILNKLRVYDGTVWQNCW